MSSTLDWANLFEEEAPRLMRFLRRFGPRISAEDISQDAFAKLISAHASKEDAISSPRAYLIATARNLALNDLRRLARSKTESAGNIDDLIPADAVDAETRLIDQENAKAVSDAFDGLEPHLRDALIFYIVEGMTQPVVAKKLGVSRRTVQRYIETGLAQLTLALTDPDV